VGVVLDRRVGSLRDISCATTTGGMATWANGGKKIVIYVRMVGRKAAHIPSA
jgi:hypothetical protein